MWTAETEASLRKWIDEGVSFSKISKLMETVHGAKLSRNACCGKAYRLGLSKPMNRKPKRVGASKPAPKASARKHDGHMPHSTKRREPYKIAPQPLVEVVFDAPYGAAQAVLALHSDQCKYPIGEGNEFHFCPSRRREGSVYCEAHHGRCYIKPDPKRKGIERGVEKASGAMWGWA